MHSFTKHKAVSHLIVDRRNAIGGFSNLFEEDVLDALTLPNSRTGETALYGLPVGRITNYLHVWKNLLEQAGFTLADIPREWDAFWSFWCDQVQPAVRQASAVTTCGASASPCRSIRTDTENGFWQFMIRLRADYVTRDGRLVIDDPEVRRRLIEAIDGYTAIYRKGCSPPDSITWAGGDNNEQFLAQNIVMTLNMTLSIPNMLKATRPDDYYENAVTIEWPDGVYGEPLAIVSFHHTAPWFSRTAATSTTAKEFVRFLVGEGWLAHYLDFAGDRMLPPMPKLLQAAVLAGPERPAPDALGHADF